MKPCNFQASIRDGNIFPLKLLVGLSKERWWLWQLCPLPTFENSPVKASQGEGFTIETMPLSQLLITLDSFQSLLLAIATLLKRAWIWAESNVGGAPWLGSVSRPEWLLQSSGSFSPWRWSAGGQKPETASGEVAPKCRVFRATGDGCPVSDVFFVGAGMGFGVQC